jgi:hypothetical protein
LEAGYGRHESIDPLTKLIPSRQTLNLDFDTGSSDLYVFPEAEPKTKVLTFSVDGFSLPTFLNRSNQVMISTARLHPRRG